MFKKLETNAVQEEILDRYVNKYTSVYGEKIRETCKAAEIRQSVTDQLVKASPQELPRTLEELLRIESTSLRIRDSEKARETEERLAQNKSNLASKFYEVPTGRDNRWSELHPARFLPGMACTATKQFKAAREVIGLTSPLLWRAMK
jgi:hypothetical protein